MQINVNMQYVCALSTFIKSLKINLLKNCPKLNH